MYYLIFIPISIFQSSTHFLYHCADSSWYKCCIRRTGLDWMVGLCGDTNVICVHMPPWFQTRVVTTAGIYMTTTLSCSCCGSGFVFAISQWHGNCMMFFVQVHDFSKPPTLWNGWCSVYTLLLWSYIIYCQQDFWGQDLVGCWQFSWDFWELRSDTWMPHLFARFLVAKSR